MMLRLGRPRTALVLAPHPDDEVIGAALLIDRLRARGCRVTVAVVSDGAASHPGSAAWPKARLVRERRRECRRGLRRLRVSAGAVRFLDLPDGALSRTDAGCSRTVAAIIAACAPELLIVPASDDAHPDHRMVATAAAAAAGRRIRTLSYRVWPPAGRQAERRAASLAAQDRHAWKASLVRCHRTQTGTIRDDPAGFAIARHELSRFARPIERFVERR